MASEWSVWNESRRCDQGMRYKGVSIGWWFERIDPQISTDLLSMEEIPLNAFRIINFKMMEVRHK